MSEELFIAPEVNTEKNLAFLTKKTSELAEASLLELRELADTLCERLLSIKDEALGVYEMLQLISDGTVLSSRELHQDALDCNKQTLLSAVSLIEEEHKAAFTLVLLESLLRSGFNVSEHSFLSEVKPSELVTYVKNIFSDEAFDVFSIELTDARVKYAENIKAAVRSLLDSDVGYAILPIEEGGSRIHTIDELIYQNDLRIVAITPVFGQGADTDLKYALVSRALVIENYTDGDDRYIEIRVSKCKTKVLLGILIAAELFSLDVYRMGTVSFGKGDAHEDFYSLILKSEGSDFVGILTYLTLFTDDFTVVGMYKNLE